MEGGRANLRHLGHRQYHPVWEAMRSYTEQRSEGSRDELWLVEHPPIFTLGRNADPTHILNPGNIPVVRTDRGGQSTYHGPGQVVLYLLLDLTRRRIGVRQMVMVIEAAVMALLAKYAIHAHTRSDAPGVYVNDAKIASLGLRVRRGCTYHGLSINVAMDLEPFSRINPCGHAGLAVTQLSDLDAAHSPEEVAASLIRQVTQTFGITCCDPLSTLP